MKLLRLTKTQEIFYPYQQAFQLEKYFAYVEQADLHHVSRAKSSYHDAFLASVVDWLREQGHREIHQQYTIAGVEADIVLVIGTKTYCLNLVGYPGEMEEAMTIEQFNILQRVNVLALPVSYSHWYFNREATITYLSKNISHQ